MQEVIVGVQKQLPLTIQKQRPMIRPSMGNGSGIRTYFCYGNGF